MTRKTHSLILLAALALPVLFGQEAKPRRDPDVPYVPTTEKAVVEMLKLANIKKTDIVYDLGCGDGRIVIAAAKTYGAHGVGIDINPVRIKEARDNAKKAGVEHLVRFEENDLFEADFHEATVVTLFLLPNINLKLKPRLLEQLKPGTRVVSNTFDMGDWKPEREKALDDADDEDTYLSHKFFLWTIPQRASKVEAVATGCARMEENPSSSMNHNPIDPAFEEPVQNADDTSFGDILSQFEQEQHEHTETGQPIEGTVVVIHDDFAFIDVGRKTEGLVPVASLKDDNGEIAVKPGDKLLVNIVGRNQEGYYELSTVRVERPKDWSGLQSAFAEARVIGGVVQEVIKGGLRVDIGARAFMPASRSGARDIAEMERLVGQEIRCKITKLDVEKEDVVVDRRVVLEEEERQRKESVFGGIAEGQVTTGTVKTLMDFGAFIDLGGVDGLLHVADISWTRINKPADVLKAGDQVEVKVLKINRETRKISLGMKQLQPDPWTLAAEQFKQGDRLRGTVARIADFGAFVNLSPGVDGLVHVSEMSWSKKMRRPQDIVTVGDAVEVVVLGINTAERRISLGLKQALGDPWEEAQKRYPVGSVVEARITNLANFGAFVDLGEGVEGMIHVGDITREKRIDHPKDVLKAGQSVRAQVLEFDKDRLRIRLGMKQLEPTSSDIWISEHQPGETVTGRIVDVKNDRAKVEVGEGVFAMCRLSGGEGKGESKGGPERTDISAMTAMLAARWKSGPDYESEQKVVKPGQVRQFRILSMDPQSKRIEIEAVAQQ